MNAVRYLTTLDEGSTVNYTCDSGYKLLGEPDLIVTVIRTCENGSWTGSEPICEGKV